MELPVEIQWLIKEYSMPLTRSDWRTIHRMNNMSFLREIGYTYNKVYLPVIHIFINRYENTPYTKYKYVRYSYDHSKPIAFVLYNDHYK